VISGAIDALVKLYGLSDYGKGWTVAIALVGTVVGALGAGVVGQKLGGRETLRITAVLYVVSAVGSALAWSWPSLMVFRFVGGLGIGASSWWAGLHCGAGPAKWRGRLVGAFSSTCLRHPGCLYLQYLIGYCTWARRSGVAGGNCRTAGCGIFSIALRHSAQSALVCRQEPQRRALQLLKLMGEPDPESELADIRAALAQEHAHGPRAGLSMEVPLSALSGHLHRRVHQLAGINAILYYLNNIFAAAGFSQISGDQQAIAIASRSCIHHCWYVGDRPAGPLKPCF